MVIGTNATSAFTIVALNRFKCYTVLYVWYLVNTVTRLYTHWHHMYSGFRNSLLQALSDFQQMKNVGMFINSCYIHCQTWTETWHGPNSPKLNNKVMLKYYNYTLWSLSLSKHIFHHVTNILQNWIISAYGFVSGLIDYCRISWWLVFWPQSIKIYRLSLSLQSYLLQYGFYWAMISLRM